MNLLDKRVQGACRELCIYTCKTMCLARWLDIRNVDGQHWPIAVPLPLIAANQSISLCSQHDDHLLRMWDRTLRSLADWHCRNWPSEGNCETVLPQWPIAVLTTYPLLPLNGYNLYAKCLLFKWYNIEEGHRCHEVNRTFPVLEFSTVQIYNWTFVFSTWKYLAWLIASICNYIALYNRSCKNKHFACFYLPLNGLL